jgi:putative transposase
MPRIARVVAVGEPHHITQRGNYRKPIFIDDHDRRKYLSFLQFESARYGLEILAYGLMDNHVHVIALPKTLESMAHVFKYVNMKYAQYFHQRTQAGSGHLWQGRFFSCVMDETYLVACARYIERNPVRAKMVAKPCEWRWSSARIHSGLEKRDPLGVVKLFDYVGVSRRDWREFIEAEDHPTDIEAIKEHTIIGRPLGSASFIDRLEEKLGRVLKPKTRGRPKKEIGQATK